MVRIEMPKHGFGKVFVDGRDVSNTLAGFTFKCRAGGMNELSLDMNPSVVELTAYAAKVTTNSQSERRYELLKKMFTKYYDGVEMGFLIECAGPTKDVDQFLDDILATNYEEEIGHAV